MYLINANILLYMYIMHVYTCECEVPKWSQCSYPFLHNCHCSLWFSFPHNIHTNLYTMCQAGQFVDVGHLVLSGVQGDLSLDSSKAGSGWIRMDEDKVSIQHIQLNGISEVHRQTDTHTHTHFVYPHACPSFGWVGVHVHTMSCNVKYFVCTSTPQ